MNHNLERYLKAGSIIFKIVPFLIAWQFIPPYSLVRFVLFIVTSVLIYFILEILVNKMNSIL